MKYRRKVFDNIISECTKVIFEYIAPNYNITLQEWNHDKSNVHILFKARPNTQISKFIMLTKVQIVGYYKKNFTIQAKTLEKYYWSQSFCLLTTVGVAVETIRKYIEKEVFNMDYVLQTKDLCKYYRNFKALNGLTMNVPKGAIYGFVGKNGAGKTTLIRLICGLQPATSGEFTLYGKKNNDRAINASRRRMGAVVETPSLYTSMTAEDNLKMQYRNLGLFDYKDIPELLKLVGLSDTGKKKAKNFSLGMRQRLGIAVALVGNPDFIILDEPINGLDPQGIIEIRELILKLNREKNITVLISSHILDELSRLATYYGFIDGGTMVKEISAEDLEKSCRKCMRVTVSEAHTLVKCLNKLELEYNIIDDNTADIFGDMTATKLINSLQAAGYEVMNIAEHDESLESYFMKLVGSAKHK